MDSPVVLQSHVIISLIAIATGVAVLYGLLSNRRLPAMTLAFLVTSVVTDVTGFFFVRDRVLPSQVVGVLSLAILAIALFALYAKHLRHAWRATYVITAVIGLYLNVFVLVAQGFLHVAPLHELAPTGQEPPFAVAQGLVLLAFVVLGWMAFRRFRPVV